MMWRLEQPQELRAVLGYPDVRVQVREAQPADFEQIMAIEAVAQPMPWTREVFEADFALDYSHCWVFEVQQDAGEAAMNAGTILGYLVFWVVYDEVHILNVAVAPQARRRRVASAAIGALIERAAQNLASFVTLEVRRHNQGARLLYESLGFIMVGARPGYYADTGEDAIILSYVLDQ